MNVRAVAASVLTRIINDGYSLNEAISVEDPELDLALWAFDVQAKSDSVVSLRLSCCCY